MKTTPLCKLAYKYGSDKCPQISHTYTPFYYNLLKDKRHFIKKVLEIGIGSPKYMHYHPNHYVTGASLYMWRDFFPNATIYGADIDPNMLFNNDRIHTLLCNETKRGDLENLIKKTGSNIDLFIDDGLHTANAQIFLCQTIMPMLSKKVIYIIEDVAFPKHIISTLNNYHCTIPHLDNPSLPKNRLILVRSKT